MNLAILCKNHRKNLGLSQVEFAVTAGISLPCLQSLEAGNGNPTLDTIEKLLKAMSLKIDLRFEFYQWDQFCDVGAPLKRSAEGPVKEPTKQLLYKTLRQSGLSLIFDPEQTDAERKKVCYQALVIALKLHFPTIYQEAIAKKLISTSLLPEKLDGKIIKLARIATLNLAQYL